MQMADPMVPKAEEEFVSKPKGGFWRSLLAMLKGLFKSKSMEKGPTAQNEIALNSSQDSESIARTGLSNPQDEGTSKEAPTKTAVEVQQESPTPKLQDQEPITEPLEEVVEVVVEHVQEPKTEPLEEVVEVVEDAVEQGIEVIEQEVPVLEDSTELVESEQEPSKPELGVEEFEMEPLEEVVEVVGGAVEQVQESKIKPLEPQVRVEEPIIEPLEEEVLEEFVEDVLDDDLPEVE